MLAHYEYDLLKAPIGQVAVALGVGTVVHAAFEALLSGGDWKAESEKALANMSLNTPRDEKLEKIHAEWDAVSLCIERAWKTPDDWEIIAVEKEMEVKCGRHVIVGRLDSIVRWNGGLWHLQHKTVPTNKVLAIYAEQQRTDWHESAYQAMIEVEYPEQDVSGTLLNCIRKLSTKAAIEKPHTAFERFYLPRSKEEVDEAFTHMEQEIDDIEEERLSQRLIIKNRSFCAGAWGNSICAFKEVCDGVVSIDDTERFSNTEPRYSTEAEAN
jgi:hypothetical protein